VDAHHLLPLQEGQYVKISITDQGAGIPAEHLSKIFDPYFTTRDSGSGLGLTIAYNVVARHQGYITAESALGGGTTMHIYLPASPNVMPVKEDVQATPGPGKGTILIMDDEEAIRDIASQMLITLGYEVTCALDGEEAIALYQNAKESGQPFRAVILDLTVPGGMGGEETIEKLRAMDPQVKAIVSSGYANAPVIADFRRYGFNGVAAKPYTIAELGEVLQRVLTERE
jgi:two-component system cell cycle sensor histidine kinase/response regulator CckA